MKKIIFVLLVAANAFAEILPTKAPEPSDNPSTPEKIALGKQLFFDGRLSLNNKISCNSCHTVTNGGVDGEVTSLGVDNKRGGRNSPTVINSAFMSVQFWDGRAKTLEEQALGPMLNPVEMAMPNHNAVVEKLKKIPGYVGNFEKVFGKEDPLTIGNVVKAIAAYERTLISPNSPYDKFMAGNKKWLNKPAQRGLEIAKTIGCLNCHSGPNFAGPMLDPGSGFYQKFPLIPGSEYEKKYELSKDLGRYEHTKDEADKNVWRVPTWRNITKTAPYFHNGKVATLPEAVRVMGKTQLGKDLTKDEVHDIVEFMMSLNSDIPLQRNPKLPPTPRNVKL
jgi:cytochrome c peroxidase